MNATTLSARWILPIDAPPMRDAHVQLRGTRVVAISQGRPADATDLGDVALLPGLINAHCHLEFSHLQQPIGTHGTPLEKWIIDVVRHRESIHQTDPTASVIAGLREAHRAGTRLVCDIATTNWSRSVEWPEGASVEAVLMPETIGLSVDRASGTFEAARRIVDNAPPPRLAWGISPHAPYSTLPKAVDQCVELACKHNFPLAMHVAESSAEDELTVGGRGPFVSALRDLGVWREGLFPSGRDQLRLIELLCQAPRTLIVHGNYLTDSSIQRLAAAPHTTVVYCPRTHAFFRHPRHRIDKLLAAGVRVALGTDSRASNPDLSLWREVQYLWRHRPDVDPQTVLRCATRAGADALGRPDLGRITVGAMPGLLAVPTTAMTVDELFEQLAEKKVSPQWVG